MKLLHDYILVSEVINHDKIAGTDLTIKYDDSERFMIVEIIKVSPMILEEYLKQYPDLQNESLELVSSVYEVGNKLVINRVAKTPYKDGQYFISCKDVIAKVD